MADYYLEDPVDLKEGINIQDLREEKGAQFEVNVDPSGQESDFSNRAFPGEAVLSNLLSLDEETHRICDQQGLDTFEALQQTMEDITDAKDGGVYKRILKNGAGPVVPHGALVRVHYNAYLDMEAEPFDSTRLRQQPEKFRLGIGPQVEGLHVAVGSMKKGETSRFLFQPQYFLGVRGCEPRVPRNSTVLFEIELLSYVEREGVDDYYEMTEEERKQVSFEFVCKVAKAEREEGNQLYNGSAYSKAWTKYKQAARILEEYSLKNEEEEEQQQKVLVRVYINMALCCQKLKQNGITITYCNKALAFQPKNVKAIYHKAQALHFMSEFEDARNLYLKAQRLDSANKAIANALRKLDQDMKKFAIQSEQYKQMCQRMVSAPVGDTAKDSAVKNEEDGQQCSARFRATVEEKMEEFFKNPDLTEMPFPEQSLTVPEIECIVEVAENFGMIPQRKGTGNAARMVVVKRKDQLQFEK